MGKQLAKKDNFTTICEFLQQKSESLRTASSRQVKIEQFIKVAQVAIHKNEALMKCTPGSVYLACMEALQLGLDLSGAMGEAYLVPYGKVATMIVGYKGLITLACKTGDISYVDAIPVFHGEPFEITRGLKDEIVHETDPDIEWVEGNLRGVYCRVFFKDGAVKFHYVPKSHCDRIRGLSKAGQSEYGPWKNHYVAMAQKTAIRAGLKTIPMVNQSLQERLAYEDSIEFDGAPPDTGIIDVEAAEPSSKVSDVAGKIGAKKKPETEPEQEKKPDEPKGTKKKGKPEPEAELKSEQTPDAGPSEATEPEPKAKEKKPPARTVAAWHEMLEELDEAKQTPAFPDYYIVRAFERIYNHNLGLGSSESNAKGNADLTFHQIVKDVTGDPMGAISVEHAKKIDAVVQEKYEEPETQE